LGPNETITAAVPVPNFEEANFCTMATRNGRVKRVRLSEFASVRPSGLIAMGLADGDSLGWVRLTKGEDEILIITERGQALRFSEKLVRPMGRPAAGVTGIKTRGDDKIIGMEVVEPEGDLLVVTTKGYGKRTNLDEYTPKGRATMGILTLDKHAIPEVGKIAVARVVQPADDLITLISSQGIVLRTDAKSIAQLGRATRGVRVMHMQEGDTVATMARFSAADMRRIGADKESEKNQDTETVNTQNKVSDQPETQEE
jgi:DNA gyrase subunit A